MTEENFQLFQELVTYLELCCYGVCLSWFLGKVYCDISVRKIGQILTFVGYMGFYVFRFRVLDVPGWGSCIWIYILFCLFLRKKQVARHKLLLFLLVTWYCVQNICMLIEGSLFNLISDIFLIFFEDIEVFFLQLAVTYAFSTLLRIGMVVFMMIMLAKRIGKSLNNLSGKEVVYLLLMPVAGVLFGNIIIKLLFVVKEETYFSLYEEFPYFHILVPLVGILFYLGILFSVSAYNSMLELQEEKKKNFVQEQKVLSLKNRMKEMAEFFDTARRTRHDMKNHITALKGLLAKGAVEDADAYLNQMDLNMGTFDFYIRTGNAVTDVLINDYYRKTKAEGIDFQVSFQMKENAAIEAFDMAIVLGNLLENALEACTAEGAKDRKIEITGKKKNKFYLLQVKNTFTGNIEFDDKTGLPVSTKADSDFHGLGLENVARVVEKYLGSMEVTVDKEVFCVTVLFQGRGGLIR